MGTLSKEKNTQLIKDKAKELGFFHCGISRAGFLEEEAPRLENWLNQNKHGDMEWMNNHFDKRLDPTKLVDGAKSVVSFLLNYFPKEDLTSSKDIKISKYAYGKDYHNVIKKKLRKLVNHLQEEIGDIQGRVFVDSAPVMDKAWAAKSGLGWVGKHTNLINKDNGSFFFIAEFITDLELEYDTPTNDHCGTCTKCIDACPTDAISDPYVIDGSKCISYFTIELKDKIPDEYKGKFDNWAFGCDICQDVCPWNRFSQPTQEKSFQPNQAVREFSKDDWTEITQDLFDEVFAGSAIKRTKLEGLKRNIDFILKP